MSVQDMIKDARMLSIDERKQLIKALVDMIDDTPKKQSSIRKFRGVGAHAYTGTDATTLVNKIRDEWE